MLPSFYWDLYPVKRRQHNDKNSSILTAFPPILLAFFVFTPCQEITTPCFSRFTPCQITADDFSLIVFFCKDTIKAYGLYLRPPQLEVEFLHLKFSYSSSVS